MGMIKTTSLKLSFWKFLCMLLTGLIVSAAIPFSLIFVGTSIGFITYADYSERSAKNLVPVIAATPDLTDVQLPMGCRYLILDKNYQVVETSLGKKDLDAAMDYAISGKINENLNKQYLLIKRNNEYVVLQYYIGSQFTNEWFYGHFPSPEVILYVLIAVNCIAVCVILTTKFAKNMRVQLSPLFEATEQVSRQNLDFVVGHSKIKEFEDVLCSFADMKNNLKISLEKQWTTEQLQREQIAALAHDLKTPLTVIQGNIDLMSETSLDDEQRLYAEYITESSGQIGFYIKTLIDISRTVAGYQPNLEEFDISGYMEQIEAQTNALCLTKGICLRMEKGINLGTFKADRLLLERAIMNVVANALDYSPPKGTIYADVQKANGFLYISITDEGGGFTLEALHHAQEQFFTGDKSRTSNMHSGMGLYITSSIIKQHNGQLILKNSDKTKGAQVIIKIPY
ncbi:MAG: HAMP domain-containing histidine kinase [Lachnospiraceae bacterium]|nr:HAMP domain-containing histidine kinase [Lachnospiraceae bacterium]